MEKDPAARFPTAAEMTAALEGASGPIPVVEVTQPLSTTSDEPSPTSPLPRRGDRPPPRRRLVPLLIVAAVLALVGGLAFALLSADPPDGSAAVASPSRSVSPSPSPSPSPSRSPSPSPSPPSVDPVSEAVAALEAVVADGVASGRITSKGAEEIQKGLDDALEKFAEGDTEKAIEELAHLEEKVDELVDHDEIHQSQEHRIDAAIEDLARQMELMAPSEDD
jgi:hypothetical protein